MGEGQIQGAIVHAVKWIGYHNVKELYSLRWFKKLSLVTKTCSHDLWCQCPLLNFCLSVLGFFVRFTLHPMQTTVRSAIFKVMCTRVKVLINILVELIG